MNRESALDEQGDGIENLCTMALTVVFLFLIRVHLRNLRLNKMKYRWSLAPPQPLLAGQLAAQLKIPPLLAQCLLNRGFSEPPAIEKFLHPRLKDLADPFLLPDMAVAVERLLRAREQNEPLVIFGDYDVDGVTSTALLLEVLRALGWKADFYLPNRMDEGYGLSADGVENCLKRFPVTLLLAVDCGSTAVETIRLAPHSRRGCHCFGPPPGFKSRRRKPLRW